jgi:hypothetical protein
VANLPPRLAAAAARRRKEGGMRHAGVDGESLLAPHILYPVHMCSFACHLVIVTVQMDPNVQLMMDG